MGFATSHSNVRPSSGPSLLSQPVTTARTRTCVSPFGSSATARRAPPRAPSCSRKCAGRSYPSVRAGCGSGSEGPFDCRHPLVAVVTLDVSAERSGMREARAAVPAGVVGTTVGVGVGFEDLLDHFRLSEDDAPVERDPKVLGSEWLARGGERACGLGGVAPPPGEP